MKSIYFYPIFNVHFYLLEYYWLIFSFFHREKEREKDRDRERLGPDAGQQSRQLEG